MPSILGDDRDRTFNQNSVTRLTCSVIYLIIFCFFAYAFFHWKSSNETEKETELKKKKKPTTTNKQTKNGISNWFWYEETWDFQKVLYKICGTGMIIFNLALKWGEGSQFWSAHLANRLYFFKKCILFSCGPVVKMRE